MSKESKQNLIKSIETQLSYSMPASDVNMMISVLRVEMEKYNVNRIEYNIKCDTDMVKYFINALKISGRSKKTLDRYEYIINKFLTHVNVKINEISVHDVRRYLTDEKDRGVSDRTIEGERQIFHRFFGWIQREGLIMTNPVANVFAIKYRKKVKDLFSEVDVELMKNSCKKVKSKAIITFLLSTGCRVEEMVNLNKSDINLETLECKVIGKGNKERIVYLDNVTAMFMRQYLNERNDDNKALFVNLYKDRMRTNGVRKVLKIVEKNSGVQNVHPHKFRRTFATNLIRRGMPIEEVAAILGHEKLDTTMEYIILDNSDIKHAYNKYC